MSSGKQIDAILLDFSKAFDKVPHRRLLMKLDHYGIRGTTLKWILSQGIIAPVNEKEHIPISSLIVLVSRRNRPNSGLEIDSNEGSLLTS
jgi:hypothetical protein